MVKPDGVCICAKNLRIKTWHNCYRFGHEAARVVEIGEIVARAQSSLTRIKILLVVLIVIWFCTLIPCR